MSRSAGRHRFHSNKRRILTDVVRCVGPVILFPLEARIACVDYRRRATYPQSGRTDKAKGIVSLCRDGAHAGQ